MYCINQRNTVLTKIVASRLNPVSFGLAAILSYYVITTMPSDAESREEQDVSKQKFFGGQVMARFSSRCSKKHGREMKMKDLNPADGGRCIKTQRQKLAYVG